MNSIVFSDFEHRMNVEFSPEILETRLGFDAKDIQLAHLFIWLESFNNDIQSIRKKHGISVIQYPHEATVDQLVELFVKEIDYEKYHAYSNDFHKMLVKYRLTENWFLSLNIAVLTHTLLVPAKLHICVHIPEKEISIQTIKKEAKSKNLKDLAKGFAESVFNDPEIKRMQFLKDLGKYPSIYFTYNTSPDELIKWINKNRRLIRYIQRDLPKKHMIKRLREEKTLFWGQMAWILKQDNVASWSEMTDILDKMIERSADNGDNSPFNEAFAPSGIELEKYYTRFEESLKNLQPQL